MENICDGCFGAHLCSSITIIKLFRCPLLYGLTMSFIDTSHIFNLGKTVLVLGREHFKGTQNQLNQCFIRDRETFFLVWYVKHLLVFNLLSRVGSTTSIRILLNGGTQFILLLLCHF